MKKIVFLPALFLSIIKCYCELVVKPEDEAKLSSEYLLGHAEVVRTYQQEGPCPEVQDEVRILRYYVQLGPETRQERNVGALVQSVTNI